VRRNGVAVILGAAVLAATLASAGCAPVATKTSAMTDSGAAGTSVASTTAATPTGGAVHMMAYSINSDGPFFRVILTGAIGDYGPAVTVYPNGQVDPQHTSDMELKLTHGSFRLRIDNLEKKLLLAFRRWPANPATCSGRITATGAVPVVAGSGTGLYRGISGRFAMAVTVDEVDVKPVCDGTGKFLAQVILLTGAGTVSFR